MKHTPGPWNSITQSNEVILIKSGHTELARVNPNFTESQTNASLIAAAPDMLNALQYIVKVLGPLCMAQDTPEGIAYHEAEKAISKANGNR